MGSVRCERTERAVKGAEKRLVGRKVVLGSLVKWTFACDHSVSSQR